MSDNKRAVRLIAYLLSKLGVCDFINILKLLYFIDFESYYLYKKSITGVNYYHLPHGPVPTRDYRNLLFEIGQQKGLFSIKDPYFLEIEEYDPALEDSFDKLEKHVIESILNKYGHLEGKELEAISHEDEPWVLTRPNELIDYSLVAYRDAKIEKMEDITDSIKNA